MDESRGMALLSCCLAYYVVIFINNIKQFWPDAIERAKVQQKHTSVATTKNGIRLIFSFHHNVHVNWMTYV
jgi:hypothetical protein